MSLFQALRQGFPADLDATAISVCDAADAPLHYRWRDLDEGSAMLANLFADLGLQPGERVVLQVEKSVEAGTA